MADQNSEFTTINNEVAMHYDASVIGNPEWLTIPEAAKMLELGDRQTRNKCKEFSWEKRYAKVEGRPVAYLKKADVLAYTRERGPFLTPEEGHVVSETAGGEVPSHTGEPLKETPEKGLKPYRAGSDDITALLASLENKLSPQITTFVETHKKVVEELAVVHEKNSVNEQKVTFWRTSMFWLVGISIVLVGGLGWLWFTVSQKAGELAKSNTELSTSLGTTQKELYETKLSVVQKENELLKLKNGVPLVAGETK
jgi:hypothetical protein